MNKITSWTFEVFSFSWNRGPRIGFANFYYFYNDLAGKTHNEFFSLFAFFLDLKLNIIQVTFLGWLAFIYDYARRRFL